MLIDRHIYVLYTTIRGDGMASLQKRNNKGHDYWYVVESKRVNGKPRPIVIQYLGTIENILRHFREGTDDSKAQYKSYAHGAVAALFKIAQKTDLLRIMAECELPKISPTQLPLAQ